MPSRNKRRPAGSVAAAAGPQKRQRSDDAAHYPNRPKTSTMASGGNHPSLRRHVFPRCKWSGSLKGSHLDELRAWSSHHGTTKIPIAALQVGEFRHQAKCREPCDTTTTWRASAASRSTTRQGDVIRPSRRAPQSGTIEVSGLHVAGLHCIGAEVARHLADVPGLATIRKRKRWSLASTVFSAVCWLKSSFILRQAYYFGSVNNNPDHRAVITEGDFIDLRD